MLQKLQSGGRVHVVAHNPSSTLPLTAIGVALQERGHDVVVLSNRQSKPGFLRFGLNAWTPAASWWAHGQRSSWVATRSPGSKHNRKHVPAIIVTDVISKCVHELAMTTGAPILHIRTEASDNNDGRQPEIESIHVVSPWLLAGPVSGAVGFCVMPAKDIAADGAVNRFARAHKRIVGVCLPSERIPAEVASSVEASLSKAGVAAIVIGQKWKTSAAELRHFVTTGYLPTDLLPRFDGVIHTGQSDVVAQVAYAGIPSIGIRLEPAAWLTRLEAVGIARVASFGPPDFQRRLEASLVDLLGDGNLHARASLFGLYVRSENGVPHVVAACERLALHAPREEPPRSRHGPQYVRCAVASLVGRLV